MTYLHEAIALILFFVVGFLYVMKYKNIYLYERIQVFLIGIGIGIGILDLLCI